jgi:hypothetical protein
VYDAINKTEYYKIYNNNETKKQYTYLKQFLNKTAEDVKEKHTQYINNMSVYDNHFNGTEKSVNKQMVLMTIIQSFNINLLDMPYKITNKDFKTASSGVVTILKAYYNNHLIENNKNYLLDITSKDFIKNIKRIISEFLSDININIKYESAKNTTRDGDKMIINYSNFQTTKTRCYEGRLNPDIHFRLRPDEVIKFRKGFKYNALPAYKCVDKNYFTTYEIESNKHITKLRTNKTDETLYKIIFDGAIRGVIEVIMINKNKPIVMTDEAYKTNENLFIE